MLPGNYMDILKSLQPPGLDPVSLMGSFCSPPTLNCSLAKLSSSQSFSHFMCHAYIPPEMYLLHIYYLKEK